MNHTHANSQAAFSCVSPIGRAGRILGRIVVEFGILGILHSRSQYSMLFAHYSSLHVASMLVSFKS